jgi:flagellum-specific peptidoglycan hydrolase FlgJ
LISLVFSLCSCGSSRKVVIQETQTKQNIKEAPKVLEKKKTITFPQKTLNTQEKINQYIDQFAPIAQQEMKSYGIPASITLAQGLLESGMGYGRLAIEGNNHFGIKCHKEWNGKRIYHDDDKKGECFRVYKNPAISYRDHSLFLRERNRYEFLFDFKTDDYKSWAKGLKKAGYATDPKYPDKLISLIERFDLTRFDNKKSKNRDTKYLKKISKKNKIHTVVKGDTLYSVSKKYNVPLDEIIQLNKIKDQTIYLGQSINIPNNL